METNIREEAQAAEAQEAGAPSEAPPPGTHAERRAAPPGLDLIRAGAIVLALLGILALLHFAASVFITLFSALLLAFGLEPLVQLLCRRTPLQRHHASAVVVFLFVAMLYGLFYATYLGAQSFLSDIPRIAKKIESAPVVQNIRGKADELNRLLAEAGQRIAPPETAARPKSPPQILTRDPETLRGSVIQGLGSLSGVLYALGFIPFLVYFILADREPLTRRTRELFPEEHRATVGEILFDIERVMRKFLLGNAVIALILSSATVFVFLIVGLPYPVVLGILSGTLSIVPYLGLPLALLPGVVVGLVTFESGGPILILFVAVTLFHLTAANYLTPKLVGGGVRLNATASTVALLFFGWLWGGMGLLLGIPIIAVLKCVLDNVPSTRRIGMFLGQ